MNNTLHKTDTIQEADTDLQNIIMINTFGDSDSEEFDYDFDYDPNEMYYALANEKN